MLTAWRDAYTDINMNACCVYKTKKLHAKRALQVGVVGDDQVRHVDKSAHPTSPLGRNITSEDGGSSRAAKIAEV